LHLAQASGEEPVREVGAMTEDLTALARQRETLVAEQANWVQRM
jgi:hypothetical protein